MMPIQKLNKENTPPTEKQQAAAIKAAQVALELRIAELEKDTDQNQNLLTGRTGSAKHPFQRKKEEQGCHLQGLQGEEKRSHGPDRPDPKRSNAPENKGDPGHYCRSDQKRKGNERKQMRKAAEKAAKESGVRPPPVMVKEEKKTTAPVNTGPSRLGSELCQQQGWLLPVCRTWHHHR